MKYETQTIARPYFLAALALFAIQVLGGLLAGWIYVAPTTPAASSASSPHTDSVHHPKVDTRCLIPGFDGACFSREWKEALWARFTTGAPRRLRQSVERYSIVKKA